MTSVWMGVCRAGMRLEVVDSQQIAQQSRTAPRWSDRAFPAGDGLRTRRSGGVGAHHRSVPESSAVADVAEHESLGVFLTEIALIDPLPGHD